tara:strand:- start:28 stop:165 length:138 start_codon:yes stop_codon:yes gene_type:complete
MSAAAIAADGRAAIQGSVELVVVHGFLVGLVGKSESDEHRPAVDW